MELALTLFFFFFAKPETAQEDKSCLVFNPFPRTYIEIMFWRTAASLAFPISDNP